LFLFLAESLNLRFGPGFNFFASDIFFINTITEHYQASTVTHVQLSGTSENWRRTSRSCITVVRREQIRDSQTCRYDGKIYFHRYKILGLKWNARSKLFFLYHLSFLHALMKFKDIDKIKVVISETL
jgi:hypothetical protein